VAAREGTGEAVAREGTGEAVAREAVGVKGATLRWNVVPTFLVPTGVLVSKA